MGYYESLSKIGKIRKALLDEESIILFDAKIDYLISRNAHEFYKVIDKMEKNWCCEELDKAICKTKAEGIVIFGCGHDGKRTKNILEKCKYSPKYFCDSDISKIGRYIDGLRVLSLEEISEKYTDYFIVLGSEKYSEEMYHSLLAKEFPADHILYPKYGTIYAKCGKQYFDVFSPQKDEVFIDGGAFNGNTILDFISWTNKKYNKIYAFEPLNEMYKYIEERIEKEHLPGVELFQNGLWNKRSSLSFSEKQAGSYIAETGTTVISGITLDEIVGEEKVTFIKLDVEGSELNALKGARNTIRNNKPRLAICIYHKPEDIFEIPAFILELVPEYKFNIRHYGSNMWETVLYAEV